MLTTRLEHAHSCCRLCFRGLCLPPAQVQGIEGLQPQGSRLLTLPLRPCAQGPSPPPACRDLRTVPPPPGPFLRGVPAGSRPLLAGSQSLPRFQALPGLNRSKAGMFTLEQNSHRRGRIQLHSQ